ncbi:MAG: XylR N-terminal domain-containing protein, partial [Desulfotomaculales bacterium]
MGEIRLFDLKLEDLLTLQKEKGKNFLKNMRILILNAESLGVLRKDLICTLGTERAKGFLIRYGYACGYADAVSTMRDFPLQNETDTYYLGLLFHTWVGMAHAIPEEVQCQKEKQKWFCTGTWANSYEAEHHLKHFGPSTEPVCWTLTGYAGGFRTAYFGERVIYKEISCVAKGDPQCRFVGKTLGEWGDEILSDLPYYQENKLGEALEKAHARLQAQNEILKQSAAIHEQLTRMVLNGEEISAIAATLGWLIGGSVVVEDQFFRPIALFSPEKGGLPAAPDFSVREIFTGPRLRSCSAALTQEKRTVFLPPEADGRPFFRLITPIVVGPDVLGYVTILKKRGGFTELDQMTLERATTVFALKIMQTRTIAEVENRLRGDFVEDLVRGNFPSETSLIERARRLGHDLTRPHQVIIINIDDYSLLKDKFGSDEKQLLYLRGKLCEMASQIFQENGSLALATSKSEDIIVLAARKEFGPEAREPAREIQK